MLRDLSTLWRAVDPTALTATFDRFAAPAAVLVRARHSESAGIAAGYYGAFRMAEGVPGTAVPLLAGALAPEVVRSTLRSSGLGGIINARRAGQSAQAAAQNGLVRVSGSATSLVLDGARETILGSVKVDRARPRWARTTDADPCDFCAMLASRGAVYLSEETADFQAHDHCACMAEPAY